MQGRGGGGGARSEPAGSGDSAGALGPAPGRDPAPRRPSAAGGGGAVRREPEGGFVPPVLPTPEAQAAGHGPLTAPQARRERRSWLRARSSSCQHPGEAGLPKTGSWFGRRDQKLHDYGFQADILGCKVQFISRLPL